METFSIANYCISRSVNPSQVTELYDECKVGMYQQTKSACNNSMAEFVFINNMQQLE